jgi:hypothetical protein
MKRGLRSPTARALGIPIGAAGALLWSNFAAESYFRITHALAFAVNDVGMALFFALLTQEVLEATMPGGSLHTWRRAALPIVAAIGGTTGAIGAYGAFVLAGDEHVLLGGWPIVCAIDGGVAYFLVRVLIGSGGAAPFVVDILPSASEEVVGPEGPGSGLLTPAGFTRINKLSPARKIEDVREADATSPNPAAFLASDVVTDGGAVEALSCQRGCRAPSGRCT